MRNKQLKKIKNLALALAAGAFLMGATTTTEASATSDAGSNVTWKAPNGHQLKDDWLYKWGNTYYFGKDGKRYTNQFYKNWGHTYYFGSDGARYTNREYDNWGYKYYFGSDGALVTNADVTLNGVTYHADKDGILTQTQSPSFNPNQINHTYDLASWQGDGRIAVNDYIILHDVGAEFGAAANANYLRNNYESAYTQFVVGDGGQVFEVGEPGYVAWGALEANPYSPCQIELGRTYNRAQFLKDYTSYINVARYYANLYGIPLTLDAGGAGTPGVKTHNWVTYNIGGSHVDPYGYLASWGISKQQLANDIAHGVNQQQLNNTVYAQRR